MADTTELEKKSLEAHVDLCAQRYHFLEERITGMVEKIETVATTVSDVKSSVDKMSEKNNDRLINWGVGIIVFLVGVIGYLLKIQN
jgi:uncharacterized protein YoxC